jgi:hypothetical protein
MKYHQVFLFFIAAFIALGTHGAVSDDLDRVPSLLIEKSCVDCHSGDDAEGNMDLAALLKSTAEVGPTDPFPELVAASWLAVEKAILQKRMPPADEDELTANERESLTDWFHSRIVLKDGKPHIGSTPLRRLTHYEFLNSLEDLLGVKVRAEYNIISSVNIEKGFVEKVLPIEVPGESGFVNDAQALASQPVPLLEYMKCIDFALSKVNTNNQPLKKILGVGKVPTELSETQTRNLATEFLHRALRGRSTDRHVDHAIQSYRDAAIQGETLVAVKTMLRTILLLPEFYYRLETNQGKASPYRVSDFELATRLSYFLTCSTPDNELLAAAGDGTLGDPNILGQQISRLLNHPRRISLSERFAGQWIGFDELMSEAEVGELGIPTLARAQYDELLYFFDELFRSDLSLQNIIQSDWAYVSKYTINMYGKDQFKPKKPFDSPYADVLGFRQLTGSQRRGIENIYDPPRLHTVKGDRYGGIITSAAVLRSTSAPKRTSPVRRGVWMLDKIMGQKLEAPENVPPVENAIRSLPISNPSKLEIIKAHTEMESCRRCHKDIDPLGFGLENFDPSGRWRTQYNNKRDIISEGVLPGGEPFSTPQQLKEQLLQVYRKQITRNMIQRMLSYAIGRSLQPYDRITVDKIYQRIVKNDYRSSVLIREIINSPQFLCRQDEK